MATDQRARRRATAARASAIKPVAPTMADDGAPPAGLPPVTPSNTRGVAVGAGAVGAGICVATATASGADSRAPAGPNARAVRGPIPAVAKILSNHLPSAPAVAVPSAVPSAPTIWTCAPGAAVPTKSIRWPATKLAPASSGRKAGVTGAAAVCGDTTVKA